MKHNKFLASALIALMATAGLLQAQETTNRYTLSNVAYTLSDVLATNIDTGVIVTNTTPLGAASEANNLAVQLTLTGLGAGATNACAVLFQTSVDGSVWTNGATMHKTGGGATTVTCISNFTSLAVPYWRVYTITSTANGTGTNLSVTVTAHGKPGI
jgi:hypothetical protein